MARQEIAVKTIRMGDSTIELADSGGEVLRSVSDTPRTDEFFAEYESGANAEVALKWKYVRAREFAQMLERELALARRALVDERSQ